MQDLSSRVRDSLRTLVDVFRNPDLRRLELASAGSIIGTWGYLVALYVYAYDQGGAAAVGARHRYPDDPGSAHGAVHRNARRPIRPQAA